MAIGGANVRRVMTSDHVVGWAFASPAVLLIIVFGLIPIVWSALLSFQKTNLLSPPQWVGLANYRALPKDPYFSQSMVHSAIYTVLFVPLSVAGGLLTAIALNRPIRGIRVYRTAVFVPVVVSTIATVIIFLWVFDPNFGLANWLLGKLGLGPFAFFTSSNGALYSIVAMTVWGWIGFNVIVYLAALQGIPRELVEAAEIDGAGNWGIFRNVTLPLLGPVTLFLVVWSSINALQLFDEVYLATNGGPGTATYVPVFYLYKLAFQQGIAGYAAAIAYVLFAVILVLTVAQLLVGKRMVHYAP
ncbi:MAG TPA: sugar ABC transporter permease [Actinomycetota bacterium]|jgi:multiple sugar transport system permease protein|nr:sugar ABC transporter permease [Actinomycetota bacterium]